MMLEDLHTHTVFCDGRDTMEEMIEEALSKGLYSIGFSSHLYCQEAEEYCMKEEDTEKYISEISLLKEKYNGRIKVYSGIEADLLSQYDTKVFDYVIGSVHFAQKDGKFIEIDRSADDLKNGIKNLYNGNSTEFAKDYFKAVTECVKKQNADIVGHFDLITKFDDKEKIFDIKDPEYINAYKLAVDEIISLGKVFEINTGAMSRGYKRSPYPHSDILEYIAKKGGKVILTGDTHKKENLCSHFDVAYEYAKCAGIKNFVTSEDIVK